MAKQRAVAKKKSAFSSRLESVLDRFKDARVLVIGDFILDQFVWGNVERISPEAPVPVVDVKNESYMPGGALNVANNIRTLGGNVHPCGVVGRDLEGRMLSKIMRRMNIDVSGVVLDPDRPTSLKTRVIAHSQQVVRFDRESKGELPKKDQKLIAKYIQSMVPKVDCIVIEDYGKGVVQTDLIHDIVSWAKKNKKPVLVDPKEKHFSYYKGVTSITPNRKEAFQAAENLSGKQADRDVDEVGRLLMKQLKCQSVLMTLGEDGMALYENKGEVTRVPTAAQEVYDVSGAGDTVMAVFSLAVASGADLKEAAYLANLAAGIVVGKLGTATIDLSELSQALKDSDWSTLQCKKIEL